MFKFQITIANISPTFMSTIDEFQLEKGSTATPFESHTKKIYTKNDNGTYEEFYNETNSHILFDGELTNDSATLNDDIKNFKYVEVYGKNGNFTMYNKIYTNNALSFVGYLSGVVTASNNYIQPISVYFNINSKTLNYARQHGVNINTSTNAISSWSGTIAITKVIGYK